VFDISKKTDYGMELMVQLAKNYGRGYISLKEVAKERKLPLKFLEQIAGELREAELIKAKEGKGGGYVLVRSPKKISVAEVTEVLEGPVMGGCAGCPSAAICGHQEVWEEVGDKVLATMKGKSLADLTK